MAFPSSSAASVFPLLGCPVSEKLTRSNPMMWHAKVLLALRGFQLADHISAEVQAPPAFLDATGGKKGKDVKPSPNPKYEKWSAKDRTVLNYLLSNLSREIFGQVVSNVGTAASAWAAIEGMFGAQSRARVIVGPSR